MIGPMRLSLLVNILVVLAVATTLIGAGLFMGMLAVPGGAAVATTRPPSTGPLPTLNPTPSPEPTVSSTPSPTVRPTAGGTHIVQPGETLSTIGALYGVPWLQIAEANLIPPPYIIHEGDELFIPVPESPCGDYAMYTVQSGDFVIKIAQEFGVDPTELADFNNLVDWNDIRPGDLMCIPAPGWTPLPTPSG
jgi:LysM repeat protein